jgi:hypothetical protein
MAKSQLRSNKEVKKPKKDKAKTATAADTMGAKMQAAQDKAKPVKK